MMHNFPTMLADPLKLVKERNVGRNPRTTPQRELDYAPFPWLILRRWVKEMYHKWGPNNPRFRARVLGELPSQSQWAVVSLEWIEKAWRGPTAQELQQTAGVFIQVGIERRSKRPPMRSASVGTRLVPN